MYENLTSLVYFYVLRTCMHEFIGIYRIKIFISLPEDYAKDKNILITFLQRRFFLNKASYTADDPGRWWIPVTCSNIKHGKHHNQSRHHWEMESMRSKWMSPEDGRVTMEGEELLNEDNPIVFNVKQAGEYSVHTA